MVTRAAVHGSARADRVLQSVRGQRDTGGVDKRDALADALVGDEEPVCGNPAALHGLHAASDCAERRAVLVVTAEFQPRVAEALVVRVLAAEQQVPVHPLVRVGVRLDSVCRKVAVEQERKR